MSWNLQAMIVLIQVPYMDEPNRKSRDIISKFYSEWMYLARSIRSFQQSSLVLKCVKTSAENEKRALKWQYYLLTSWTLIFLECASKYVVSFAAVFRLVTLYPRLVLPLNLLLLPLKDCGCCFSLVTLGINMRYSDIKKCCNSSRPKAHCLEVQSCLRAC